MKSTIRAFSLSAAVTSALLLAAPAEARIMIDALGGEVKLEGSLSSEARARVGAGETYLTQWIQRFELNAEINYTGVGPFDTLSFVTVIRPEFDAAYYYGDSFNGRGNGGNQPSYLGDRFTAQSDPVGFGGFDYVGGFFGGTGQNTFNTGGVGKIVSEGLEDPAWLDRNFETILNRTPSKNKFNLGSGIAAESGFPVLSTLGQQELACKRCTNVDVDPLDVAMNNGDSVDNLYPFRELYMDATAGDWWFRIGKQQIVWGKTDFFRLQDLVNPVDFGQHFFFDSFEDIRIPQWIMSIQRKFGDIGPTTDNAVQLIWNFDEFKGIGLGAANAAWGHPFAKEKSTFAGFNEYFSVEPCVSAATAIANGMGARDVCGSKGKGDRRRPSGFGQPVGLSYEDRPEWKIENTEPGLRWEFRIGEFHVAISEFYGWNDVPVFRFHSVNVPNVLLGMDPLAADYNKQVKPAGAGTQDWLMFDLVCARNPGNPGCTTPRAGAGASPQTTAIAFNGFTNGFSPATGIDPVTGEDLNPPGAAPASRALPIVDSTGAVIRGRSAGQIPVRVMKPQDALKAFAALPGNGQMTQLAKAALRNNNAVDFWGTGNILGGQTDIQYKQASTTGLSFDYFESYTGVVFRIESSITIDELVNNTRRPDWTDTSDVMRWSIGLDRPTWIKWLNKDRTFFLSMQIFDTWYLDHDGGNHDGMFVDEHNFITTFFYIANYMRDTLKPVGFIVWEDASNSWVAGQSVEWLIDNHWSIKGGFNTIWGGTTNARHDSGPFRSFVVPGASGNDPYNQSVFGVAREGIGALRDNDEVFLQLKYQF